jgi:hypothetical protein
MKYLFPATKFSRINSIDIQVLHLVSEIEEIKEASKSNDERHFHKEILDALHSCETAIRIIQSTHGEDYIDELKQEIIHGNNVRNYYE